MEFKAIGVLSIVLISAPALGASVLDLGVLPSEGSVTGYSGPIGNWDGTTRPRTTEFQVAESTRLMVNVFGTSGTYRTSYQVLPEDWWLQTDESTPVVLYSGDASEWSTSTHIAGTVVPWDRASDTPLTQDTVAFSLTLPGVFHINSVDDSNDPDLLRMLGVTDPERADVTYWDTTITDATVSNLLPSMVLSPGSYEFLFNETLPTYGKTVDLSKGITLTTSTVPLPAALWLFGSGLVGLGVLHGRKSRER